jgi:hypothetical protein
LDKPAQVALHNGFSIGNRAKTRRLKKPRVEPARVKGGVLNFRRAEPLHPDKWSDCHRICLDGPSLRGGLYLW